MEKNKNFITGSYYIYVLLAFAAISHFYVQNNATVSDYILLSILGLITTRAIYEANRNNTIPKKDHLKVVAKEMLYGTFCAGWTVATLLIANYFDSNNHPVIAIIVMVIMIAIYRFIPSELSFKKKDK